MASEVDLKCQVAELERVVRGFNQKYDSLMVEKVFVDEDQSSLEAHVDSLTQSNEGLMIYNEILERDLVDRDSELEAVKAELE